jgi:hypothetical protein
LLITAFYLMAVLILRTARSEHLDADYALRLARAAPPTVATPGSINADGRSETLEVLSWALPRLSDKAFKLYAYLNLHADQATRRVTVNEQDLLLSCGRTPADEESCFSELQALGTSVVRRQDNQIVVQI